MAAKWFGLTLAAAAAAGCATSYNAKWSETAKAPMTPAPAVAEKLEAAATPVLSAEAEGDLLWKERGDQAKLEQALAKWEEAAKTTLTAPLATKLSRGHYLLGDGYLALAGNTEGRDAEYQKGLDWATTALKIAAPEFAAARAAEKPHAEAVKLVGPNAIDAMYWFATNLGKWAASKGFTTRLRYKDDIKATMVRVKELDEGFFYAAPWRYFGGFEAVTAGLAGGSLEKSEENFKKSLELAPNYLGTKVLWADYLCVKKGDRATFEKLLGEVLAADAAIDPAIAPENRLEQAKAKKLLAEIDDKF
jgi:hypothetical protein